MDHISYSSISRYLKCPKSWEYHYVAKIKAPPNSSLFMGTVYHALIAYLYGQKKVGGVVEQDLCPIMASFWKSKLPSDLVWAEDPKEARRKLKKAVYAYRDKVLPFYKPIAVERKYTGTLDGINLLAYLDLVAEKATGEKVIVDHKWRKRTAADNAILNDLQSTFYIMLSGVKLMEFHEALNQKRVDIRIRPVQRDSDDVDFLKRIIHDVLNGIEKEVFPCNPLQNLCSPQYCEFWTECRMGWLK